MNRWIPVSPVLTELSVILTSLLHSQSIHREQFTPGETLLLSSSNIILRQIQTPYLSTNGLRQQLQFLGWSQNRPWTWDQRNTQTTLESAQVSPQLFTLILFSVSTTWKPTNKKRKCPEKSSSQSQSRNKWISLIINFHFDRNHIMLTLFHWK